MEEVIYKVRIEGTKPLLMNAPNELIALEQEKLTRRRSEIPDPKKEAESRLYKDPQGRIAIPSYVIKGCLKSAGGNYRARQRMSTYKSLLKAGIDIEPEWIPLEHDGMKIDARPVNVKGNRIIRYRPRFDKWALEFYIINRDPKIISEEILKKILEDAGRWYGIGDFRPEYGLFKVVKFEQVKEKRKEI